MSRPALPAGYVTGRERGAWIVALPFALEPVQTLIHAHGSLHAAAAAAPGAEAFSGRGAAYRTSIGGADVVVRHYRRGGSIAALLGDRYVRIGAPRPVRELRASACARARGVTTPEVVCAVVYQATPFYRADIATRYSAGGRDLADAVLGARRLDEAGRTTAWRAVGAALRHAFDQGVEHADLNMRNILIAGAEPRVLLLDLDRAVIHEHGVSDAARRRMIERLHRSRRKLESQYGRTTTRAEIAALDAGLSGR